jgi:hypothetical protein
VTGGGLSVHCVASNGAQDYLMGRVARDMRPVKTILIDNYDSYTYNLFQLLAVVNGGGLQTLHCV